MAKQKENESIDVCVDDKVTNYLNGRDVQQVLHAKLIGVRKWDVCNKRAKECSSKEVEYSLHFAITPFNALVFQSGHTCLARKEVAYYMPSTSRHI
ncbi:Serine carboxypeptidase-like [Arachis hypogaea]|uniref:Serine carboxypeptidase-like n=1 Tax=Arachis hypogaea TaxID=3818 RepID=A0A6B9V9C7_ARAHY|nr:Serine carboxypeptidase-like [Arachis hypogaea]